MSIACCPSHVTRERSAQAATGTTALGSALLAPQGSPHLMMSHPARQTADVSGSQMDELPARRVDVQGG
jgi:hypothetical protein